MTRGPGPAGAGPGPPGMSARRAAKMRVPLAPMAPVRRPAGPCPPTRCGTARPLVARDVRRAHAIDRPSPFVGEARPGLALAMSVRERRQRRLGRFGVLERARRRSRERPLALGGAELLAAGAGALPMSLPGPLDHTAGGTARLAPGEAGDLLDFVEQPQGQACAAPGPGA